MCLKIKSNAPRRASRNKRWLHLRLQGPGPMNFGSAVHNNIEEQIEIYFQCEERKSFMEGREKSICAQSKVEHLKCVALINHIVIYSTMPIPASLHLLHLESCISRKTNLTSYAFLQTPLTNTQRDKISLRIIPYLLANLQGPPSMAGCLFSNFPS